MAAPGEGDSTVSTIAFIGLGIMGGPMAQRLVDAGHTVVGFNRSTGPVERLVAAGGKGAASVAEAVRDADVIITMVPDSPDVEEVALGEDGIYAHAPQGSIHIDMSSIRPDVAARLYDAGKAVGVRVMLAGGLAGSRILDRKAASMLAGNFEPGFRIDLHHKDMGIVTAAARERDVVIPLGALTAQLVAAARAQGDGGLDHSALLRGVERLSGRTP
jgi:2-hydroxy-3-oxopropionate reductase